MNKFSQKSRAELVLLAFLIVILLAVLYVRYWLEPLMTECTAIENEIGINELRLVQIDADIRAASVISEENTSLSGEIQSSRERLSVLMTEEELDSVVTEHILTSGLVPCSMTLDTEEYPECGLCVISTKYIMQGGFTGLTDLLAKINAMKAVEIKGVSMEAVKRDDTISADSNMLNITVELTVYMNMEGDDVQAADKA